MVTVYRVEEEEGYGPFSVGIQREMDEAILYSRNSRLIDKFESYSEYWHNHLPTPREEGLKGYPFMKCGVIDARTFVTWFPRPIRNMLHQLGFCVVEYEVPDEFVEVGLFQVIFKYSKARKVNTHALVRD